MAHSFIDSDGVERFLGNLMPTKALGTHWTVFGDTPSAKVIPREAWKRLIDAVGNDFVLPQLTYVHDQNGYGMCNCSATVSAAETARNRAGLPAVKLSGGDLYRRISGGSDSGSLLEDGLEAMLADGVCSVDAVPYLDWRNPPRTPDADRYKLLEAYVCPTFDHCMSAVLQGFDLISGIMWRDYAVGSDGWLVNRGGSAGGHAVHGFKGRYRGSEFGIAHKNSWKASWGQNGCCVFPESFYDGPVGGWWAVRAMTTEPGDVPAPKFS